MRIILIEGKAETGAGIAACVARMGHAIDWARDGVRGDEMMASTTYDAAILDLLLPRMDGLTVLKRMRARRCPTPALVVTSQSAIDDRVGALDVGADDFLAKPFDFRELEARLRALLRRRSEHRGNEVACAEVRFDRATRAASIHGAPLYLTRRQLELLEVFICGQTRIFAKAQLLDRLFGYGAEPSENAIEVLVTRLRRRLAGSGAHIRTHRGLGYSLVARPLSADV